MWESIKRFFGFGKKEASTPAVEVKVEPQVAVAPEVKVETPKVETVKKEAAKKPKAPKATEEKVTAKEIKAKVKKEPKAEKTEAKKPAPNRRKSKKSEE